MEPKFQTSFIPKKAIDSNVSSSVSISAGVRSMQSIGIISAISTLVFIVSLAVTGGLFGYKYLLNQQITQASADLEAARTAFDPQKIQELIDADARLASIQGLLNNHIAVSRALGLMEELVVRKVKFTSLEYTNKTNGPLLTIKGEVQSYNALAKQQEIFAKDESIKNPLFTDFSLTNNGSIGFTFSSGIAPSLISYKAGLEPEATVSTISN